MSKSQTIGRCLLGALFMGAGANHFWSASFYVAMMPPYLPWHPELVFLSGLAEFGLGALLLFKRWQAAAGWGIIALSLAVFPANVQMALHPELFQQFTPTGLWLRLPLQIVPIFWAYWYTRSGRSFQRQRDAA
ncbi:MAG: DoxX family protein [Polaromonas sp.]|uniref:DoxX family protein n=1 Tax=Polaromonas sp. TaxID=1869339 RepID=UPI00185A0718|nr:hypothetical protein [Polaromonas sp.]NMM09024.1 DoxX family protein [Polaromonas sp.]